MQSFLIFCNRSHNTPKLYATAVGIFWQEQDRQIIDLPAGIVRPDKETPHIPQITRPLFYLTAILLCIRHAYVL
jgi:hypothetical protein